MTAVKQPYTVGYILKKFPVMSETFILNEILELEAQGIPVHIFSLERPNDPRFHEDIGKLKARITFVPDILNYRALLRYSSRAKRSHKKNYYRALTYVMKHTSPSLIHRFFQSCYISDHARRYNVKHFHAHFATRPTSVAFLSAMISNLPFSFTAHAMDIFKERLNKNSLRKKIKSARFVVTVSEYNLQHLSKLIDGDAGKIVKIHNGINLERFKPEYNGKQPPFKFICVARFVEKKGHPVLIEACEILRDKGYSFECWFIGKGKQRGEINKLIKSKKLRDHVLLLGPHSQREVVGRYKEAHVYVLPCIVGSDGNRDGLPVSIIEALASGLPVITTPMTGNPEVVHSDYNGILVPFQDAESLAKAMSRIMEDTSFYEKLCCNTRSSIEKQFNIHETVKNLAELFRESMT